MKKLSSGKRLLGPTKVYLCVTHYKHLTTLLFFATVWVPHTSLDLIEKKNLPNKHNERCSWLSCFC